MLPRHAGAHRIRLPAFRRRRLADRVVGALGFHSQERRRIDLADGAVVRRSRVETAQPGEPDGQDHGEAQDHERHGHVAAILQNPGLLRFHAVKYAIRALRRRHPVARRWRGGRDVVKQKRASRGNGARPPPNTTASAAVPSEKVEHLGGAHVGRVPHGRRPRKPGRRTLARRSNTLHHLRRRPSEHDCSQSRNPRPQPGDGARPRHRVRGAGRRPVGRSRSEGEGRRRRGRRDAQAHQHRADERRGRDRRGREGRGPDAVQRREGRQRRGPGGRHRRRPDRRHDPDGRGPPELHRRAGRRRARLDVRPLRRVLHGQDRRRPRGRGHHRHRGAGRPQHQGRRQGQGPAQGRRHRDGARPPAPRRPDPRHPRVRREDPPHRRR